MTRLPLSFNQELLCMFDGGDSSGPFGPRYLLQIGLRLRGPLDPAALRGALADVVARHEPLRTRIVRGEIPRYQQVFPPSPPHLDIRECPGLSPGERTQRADVLLSEIESGTIDADRLPLLRAVLMRFDERDAVVVLITHHTATDGASMRVLARDLARYYAARESGTPADLPPMRPYRDFVIWEREQAAGEAAARARRYWTDTLRGAGLCALRTDHPRSADLPNTTISQGFAFGEEVMSGVARVARESQCSPFMVLLAAYYRLLHAMTGLTDIAVPTHTPGRGNGRFNNTVGSFFNFLPLRVDLTGCQDVRDLLQRTRATCLGAYAHDIPAIHVFEAAPDLMAPAMRDHYATVTFQVLPTGLTMAETQAGNVAFAEIIRRPISGAAAAEIPDGALWTVVPDPSGVANGCLTYRSDQFDARTVVRLVNDYTETLRELLAEAALQPV